MGRWVRLAAHVGIDMGSFVQDQLRAESQDRFMSRAASGADRLDREGEDLASREACGGGEDPQPDHPDPAGDPRGFIQRFDRDVAFERLRYPEDDSGLGLVDVSFAFHNAILRHRRKCCRRVALGAGCAPSD
jgi:hypothetical protein